jgi:CO dehydrogenase maturation factor
MKILVCGKGWAGKSALTLLMARVLAKRGRVYVLDSDESNRLMFKMMGTEAPDTIANFLGVGRTSGRNWNVTRRSGSRSSPESISP